MEIGEKVREFEIELPAHEFPQPYKEEQHESVPEIPPVEAPERELVPACVPAFVPARTGGRI